MKMGFREANSRRKWLVNKLRTKHKIPEAQTKAVLNAIADMEWDWKNSLYDLYGLCIEEMLIAIGRKRAPAPEAVSENK